MGFSSSSLASASLTTQIGGAAMSGIGSYYSAASQKTALQSQADIADTNARISEYAAQGALLQGEHQAAQVSMQAGQLKSKQKANMAANGIDLGVGSAAEVQASTDVMKESDMNTIQANALRAAWGYRTQETSYQNAALTARASASTISPLANMASSLIGGAGKVAGSWYQMNKSGALDGTVYGAKNASTDSNDYTFDTSAFKPNNWSW